MSTSNVEILKENAAQQIKKFIAQKRYKDSDAVRHEIYDLLWQTGNGCWDDGAYNIKFVCSELLAFFASNPDVVNEIVPHTTLKRHLGTVLQSLVDFSLDIERNIEDEIQLYNVEQYERDEVALKLLEREYEIKNKVRELEIELENKEKKAA